MDTKEMIEVMQGFADRKEIQVRRGINGEWLPASTPVWDWAHAEYRIKPEEKKPAYRPYKDTKEMIGDYRKRFNLVGAPFTMPLIWINNKKESYEKLFVTEFYDYCIATSREEFTLEELFEKYTYLDKSPIGKLAE